MTLEIKNNEGKTESNISIGCNIRQVLDSAETPIGWSEPSDEYFKYQNVFTDPSKT